MGEELAGKVDIAPSTWTRWRKVSRNEDEPAIALLIRATPRDVERTVAAVQAATGTPPEFAHYTLALTPDGVAVFVEDPVDFAAVVHGLASGISAANITARIEPLQQARLPLPDRAESVVARIRLSGSCVSSPLPRWVCSPEVVAAAVRLLVNWTMEAAPASRRVHVQSGLTGYALPVADEEAFAEFLLQVSAPRNRPPFGLLWLSTASGGRFRSAALRFEFGAVTLMDGGVHVARGDWRSVLDALRRRLVTFSELAAYGYIRRATRPSGAWSESALADDWVAISRHEVLRERGWVLESVKVPDAFGVQLLGRDHRPLDLDPARWRSTGLGRGARLLEHSDPEVWFADDTPSQDVVDQARRDLGDALFTQAELDRAWMACRDRRTAR